MKEGDGQILLNVIARKALALSDDTCAVRQRGEQSPNVQEDCSPALQQTQCGASVGRKSRAPSQWHYWNVL